ncbi:MAG: RDD family protein [Dehalococcoidia bacterium]
MGRAQPRQGVVGGVVDGMVLATLLRRLVCWLLDRVLKAIIFLVIVSIAGVEMAESPWASPELIVASALLNAGYDFVFGIQGITPAGYLMGLRIVALDGSEPGVRRSLLRASAASLNEVILFAGSVIALVDPRRQTMHDKIAGTIVIRTARDREG